MIEAIILGIVQGLTEFLPVSSSGHLALIENWLGIAEPMTLSVFLHFGTLIAIIVYFFIPIKELARGIFTGDRASLAYLGKIALGTVPIVIAGMFLRSLVDDAFNNMGLVAVLLGVTGGFVLLTGVAPRKQQPVTWLASIVIGIAQAFAILPGISRSGMTISAGLYSRIDPERAFRFSFLLSIPAILGANLLELKNVSGITNLPALFTGMLFSFASGLIALAVLRRTVYRRFYLFGIYCLILSAVLMITRI
ncbi:undecaprenyl-diphosphate phosphatase [candidate division WOR-3 bacterium]|nr:undecaprenyl-diphosphate phosphatase [candidate division WOR-3 bacterium]